MSTFYSPLRYPGGKNCIFPFMKELIRENELEGCSYAEPFAGGAGLALHLLMEDIVSEIYLNDLDHSIYSFWWSILNRTKDFCEWVSNVNIDLRTWQWAKSVHTNMLDYDNFELGKATFFLNRTNVSGIITGGPIGGPSQNGKYKIDARFNKLELISRIYKIVKYRKSIYLSELDGVDFLRMLNRKHKKMFIYIDPPYVNKGADLYMNFFDADKHASLRNQILKLRKHWLVSYDDNDVINELYASFNRVVYTLSQCTSNRMGNEIIIYPAGIKTDLAITKLKSPASII